MTAWDTRRQRYPNGSPYIRRDEALVLVKALGTCTSAELAEHGGCNEATAKNKLRQLWEAGLLARKGGRPWVYRVL